MRRLAVLSNPNSGGNRNGLEAVSRAAEHAGVWHESTGNITELEAVLRQFASAGVELIAVNGGDGTLGAVITTLRNKSIFVREPMLALLRGGTTNMVHRELGLRGSAPRALKRLAHAYREGRSDGHSVVRRVMAVQRNEREMPVYGFVFGAAAIPRVIGFARGRLHPRGLTGTAGESLALAWMFLRLAGGRIEHDPILHPDDMTCVLDGGGWLEERAVLLLATTLDRLILGMRPVRPDGGLGVAALTYPYRRLWSKLPAFLIGRNNGASEDGIRCASGECLSLRTNTACILDGELFAPDPASPLRLRAAHPSRFVVL